MEIGFKNPIYFTMNICITIWNEVLEASYKKTEFVITYAATCIHQQKRLLCGYESTDFLYLQKDATRARFSKLIFLFLWNKISIPRIWFIAFDS